MVTESLDVKVYYEDTDCLGIVYHPSYLRFFERGRSELLERRVAPLSELARRGLAFVVHRIEATFRAPGRLGDLLEVVTTVHAPSGYRLLFDQRAVRKPARELLVEAAVEVVCVDGEGRLRELPAEIRAMMADQP